MINLHQEAFIIHWMRLAAQYLTTDASRLHKAMDEYHQFIINELKEK